MDAVRNVNWKSDFAKCRWEWPWTSIASMESRTTNYNRVQSEITMLLCISGIEWGLRCILLMSVKGSYSQFVKINELLEFGKLKMLFLLGCTFVWQWEENSIVTVRNRNVSPSSRRICWTHGFVSLKFCTRILIFEHFQISHNSKQLESTNIICFQGNSIDSFSFAHLASFYCCSIKEREHWWTALCWCANGQGL